MRSHSIWGVLLTAVLALRVLLAPAHLGHNHDTALDQPREHHVHHDEAALEPHDHHDHDDPAPAHDHDDHDASDCKVCFDLFVAKHLASGDPPRAAASSAIVISDEPAPLVVPREPYFARGAGPRAPPRV